MQTWKNYGENQRVKPGSVVRPRSLNQVQQVVRSAAEQNHRLKCIGSAHSFSGVLLADKGETLVDVGQDNHALKSITLVDDSFKAPAGTGKQLVAAETSVVMADLADWLDERGLGLATFGAVNGQTIVGAMATGTHGSDLKFGPLSNMTRAFILVDGRGQVRLVQPSSPVLKSGEQLSSGASAESNWFRSALHAAVPLTDDDVFNACVIGIGVVGIIYAVILEVHAQYWLHETKSAAGWKNLKSRWQLSDQWHQAKATWQQAKQQLSGDALKSARDDWRVAQEEAARDLAQRLANVTGNAANAGRPLRNFMFLINPYPTMADGDHRCNVVQMVLAEPGSEADAKTCPAPPDRFAEIKQEILEAGVTVRFRWGCFRLFYRLFNRLWRLFGLDQALTTFLQFVFRAIPKSLPDIFDTVILRETGERTGPSHRILTREVYEVKGWGIEVAVDLDRLPEALDAVVAKNNELFSQGRYVTGVIAIRFVSMTDAMLGVSYDEAKIMIEPTMLKDTPHGERTLATLQRLIMDGHDGIIHWGLEWDEATRADTQKEFAHLARFREVLQQTLDPDGRFGNEYTRNAGIYDERA